MNSKLFQKSSKIKVNKIKSLDSEKRSYKSFIKSYTNSNKDSKDNKNEGVNNTNINISINNNSNNINNFQYYIYNSPQSKTNKKESKNIFPKIKSKKRVYLLHDLYYRFGNKNINKRNNNLLNDVKTNTCNGIEGLNSARNKSIKFNINNCRTEEPKQDSIRNLSSRSLAENEDMTKSMKICNLKLKSNQNINGCLFTNSIIRKNNSYNERLFNEYKRILNKEFIKYLERFKILFLKKCFIEFSKNIKLYIKSRKYLFKEFHKRNNSTSGENYNNSNNIMNYIKPRFNNTNDQIFKKIDSLKKKNTIQRNNPEFSTQKYFYTGDFNEKSDKYNYYKTMIASSEEPPIKTNLKLKDIKNDNNFEKDEEDSNYNEEKLSIIISFQDDEIINGNDNSKNNSSRKYKMSVKQNKNNDYFHNLNYKSNDLFLEENIKKSITTSNRKQQKVYIKKNNMINNIQKTKYQNSRVNNTNSLIIDNNSTIKFNKSSRNGDRQLYNSKGKINFLSNNKESIDNNDNELSNNNYENENYLKRKIPKEPLINYHIFVNNRLKNYLKNKIKKNYNSFDDGINENSSLNNISSFNSKELSIRFNTITYNPKTKKYNKRKYRYVKSEHKDNIYIASLKEKQNIIYHKKNKSNYVNYNSNKTDFIYIKEEESPCTSKTSNNNINSLINKSSLNDYINKNQLERNTYERKIKDLRNIIKNNNDNKYLVSCLNFFIKTLTKIKNNTLEEYFYKLHYFSAGNSLTEKLEDIKKKYYESLLKRKIHKNKIEKKKDSKKSYENKKNKNNDYNEVVNENNNNKKKIKKKKQNQKLINSNKKKLVNSQKNKSGSNIAEK